VGNVCSIIAGIVPELTFDVNWQSTVEQVFAFRILRC